MSIFGAEALAETAPDAPTAPGATSDVAPGAAATAGPAQAPGPGPDPDPDPDHVHLLDDPQEWPAFGRPCTPANGDRTAWESHVVLEGMHCAACALTIEDALRAVPGVQQADVSAATRRARVVWQPGRVLPSQWMAAVQQAGYRAVPAMDALARERRRQESRRALWRWLVAGFCMMQVMMYAWPAYVAQPGDLSQEMEQLLRWASWVITLPMVAFSCGPFFASALRDIRQARVSMDLPVALGMAITFAVSTAGTFDPAGLFGREVYYDSLTMFVFFLLTGRWLELRLRDRTAGALEAVMNRLPDSVERRTADGRLERVATRRLAVGDTVRVLPGEAFPADGHITLGSTHADEALLTGESTPVPRTVGSAVAAGSYNLQAPVEVRVDRIGGQTRFAQIVALMESASLQKPRLAQLADRIARPFLVAVLAAATLAAAYWWPADPGHALMVAVAVLIVTCPCALSLATPVAMLTAAGTLARHGVLVRNLQGLEALAHVDTLVFDKTGTLTRDGMALQAVRTAPGWSVEAAQGLATALARHSMHPASRALVAAASPAVLAAAGRWSVAHVREDAGLGLSATVSSATVGDGTGDLSGCEVRLGSARHANVAPQDGAAAMQVVLAVQGPDGQGVELARFHLMEDLRREAPAVVAALQRGGVAVHVLSGDRAPAVRRVAVRAGIEHAQGECSPAGKLQSLQALQAGGRQVAMVGDGLNDGPVLAGAHVSFAFGRAVPLAQSRSDFVVLGDSLALVPQTVLLARRTLRVVRQNLWWAAAYNALCVPLAVVGWMPAWLAGLGMALSSLLVVLNAARLARGLPPIVPSDGPNRPAAAQAGARPAALSPASLETV
ncbi:heavy metal translocating P-type ATPase [Paracidovorax sp. MALMAid1276]|uniref:heavy metal translocating P-type ATPase n=1 Tax=Paracidovorax sp. MALMAid1276 TaxID=3411631 RepID=UPI003B9A11FB